MNILDITRPEFFHMSSGDWSVGVGTSLLALFTWHLARITVREGRQSRETMIEEGRQSRETIIEEAKKEDTK